MTDPRRRILAEIAAHSDLEERLRCVPAWARCRGLLFDSVEHAVADAGRLDEYRALVPERHGSPKLFPVTEYLECAAIGAALLASPERLPQGLEAIGRHNVASIAESPLGRILLRVLDPDPRRLLEQGMLGRRLTCNYGRWDLTFPSARSAVVTMSGEYVWIDSLLRGAARGTFEAVGLSVREEVEMFGRFSGRHVLTW